MVISKWWFLYVLYAIRHTLYEMQYAIRNTLSVIRYPLYALRYKNMQNKPNFPDAQMNLSSVLTKDYENKRLHRRGKNKPNSNPICQRVKLMQSV